MIREPDSTFMQAAMDPPTSKFYWARKDRD
jgi:hypothetical protein